MNSLQTWDLWFALTLVPLAIVFVHFRFAPNFLLDLEPRWDGEKGQFLIVRVTAMNKALIRVMRPRLLLRIAIFDGDHPKELEPRLPLEISSKNCSSAIRIIGTTKITTSDSKFYPNEKIYWEMFYEVPSSSLIVQISLTAHIALSWSGRLLSLKKEDWYQTVSVVSVRPRTESAAP